MSIKGYLRENWFLSVESYRVIKKFEVIFGFSGSKYLPKNNTPPQIWETPDLVSCLLRSCKNSFPQHFPGKIGFLGKLEGDGKKTEIIFRISGSIQALPGIFWSLFFCRTVILAYFSLKLQIFVQLAAMRQCNDGCLYLRGYEKNKENSPIQRFVTTETLFEEDERGRGNSPL